MKRFGFISLSTVLLLGAGCAPAAQVFDSEVSQTRGEESSLTFSYPDQEEETSMPSWEFPGVLSSEQITGKQVRISTAKETSCLSCLPTRPQQRFPTLCI